jgi:transposase
MMGRLKSDQGQLFYEFHLGNAVPEDHLVRNIDAALDLSWLRGELAPHYSSMGRPSIDPELMIRMLIVGYVFAIRSERRVFERVVEACIAAGLVGGEGFAVDASLIAADANKQRSIAGQDWRRDRDPARSSRAVKEYLATLDDTAWGAASDVVPKFVSPSDPAAQWTGAHKGPAFFAYADNYLIDVKFGVIVDVEASRAIRQAEVGAARTMIERTEERFGSEMMAPSRAATFDMMRSATSTIAQAGSSSGQVALCMRARRFYIVQASSTAMDVPSNRSAAPRNHHARSHRYS